MSLQDFVLLEPEEEENGSLRQSNVSQQIEQLQESILLSEEQEPEIVQALESEDEGEAKYSIFDVHTELHLEFKFQEEGVVVEKSVLEPKIESQYM